MLYWGTKKRKKEEMTKKETKLYNEVIKAIKVEGNRIIIRGVDLSNASISIKEDIGGSIFLNTIGKSTYVESVKEDIVRGDK